MRTVVVRSQLDLETFLDELENKLEDINERLASARFTRLVTKTPQPEIEALEAEQSSLLLNKEYYHIISEWQNQLRNNQLLARRVEMWARTLLAAQVNARPRIRKLQRRLSDILVAHRYTVNGRRVSLGEVRALLRAHPDRKVREAAWQSYAELSQEIADQLLELIKLRNEAASELGFETYAHFVLELSGMALAESEAMLRELTKNTHVSYSEMLLDSADRLGIRQIQPWDVQYVLEQQGGVPLELFPKDSLVSALKQWAVSMGITLESCGIEPVFTDIPYNGLCMSLSRREIKILSNPADGYSYYQTLFHELGHALHAALKQVDSYILRRESSIFTEGVAEIFGYVPRQLDWLLNFGLDKPNAERALTSSRGPHYHYIRQRTAFCLFEYALYRNTEADPDQLLAEVEAEVLGCSYNDAPRWAANAWYIDYPVYWQNYVLADVIASQVHHHLEQEFGSLSSSKQAFDYVVSHYIAPGAMLPWQQKIERATGEKLNAKALIQDMTAK